MHQANWLRAPKAPIALMLRLYWPSETPPSILDGSWKPPEINTFTTVARSDFGAYFAIRSRQ